MSVSVHDHARPLPHRVFNFSAGPAALPEDVVREAREDLWSIFGTGIGVLEHSHRGPVIDRVLGDAIQEVRRVGCARHTT